MKMNELNEKQEFYDRDVLVELQELYVELFREHEGDPSPANLVRGVLQMSLEPKRSSAGPLFRLELAF
jgi:hypothetical protein